MLPNPEYFQQNSPPLDLRLNRSIKTNWEGYESLLTPDPTRLTDFLTDNPLVVVHPGYNRYHYPDEDPPLAYLQYLNRLQTKVYDALDSNRRVLVWTPADHRHDTLTALSIPFDTKSVLLVPNEPEGHTDLHCLLLGITSEEKFWLPFQAKVKHAEIAGEYFGYGNDVGCINGVMELQLKAHNIDVTLLRDAVYEPHP